MFFFTTESLANEVTYDMIIRVLTSRYIILRPIQKNIYITAVVVAIAVSLFLLLSSSVNKTNAIGFNCTVSYFGNGSTSGSVPVDLANPHPNNSTITVLGNTGGLSKVGYTFNNWNTQQNGSGTTYAGGNTFTCIIATIQSDLYAQWSANSYQISYNGNGNTAGFMDNQNFSYDVAQNLTTNSYTKAGYIFTGWNTAADGSGTSYTDNQNAINLTATNNDTYALYAQWAEGEDPDGDGVSSTTENAAPNNGDANGDGIPDRLQNSVISLLSTQGNSYITVEASGACTAFISVSSIDQSSLVAQTNKYRYPFGLVDLRLSCPSSTTIRYLWHGIDNTTIQNYRLIKYGNKVPGDDSSKDYFELPAVYGTQSIGGNQVAYAEYTYTDGQLGDDTGVDGVIVDPVGLAIPTSQLLAPTGNNYQPAFLLGIINLVTAFGLIALYRVVGK